MDFSGVSGLVRDRPREMSFARSPGQFGSDVAALITHLQNCLIVLDRKLGPVLLLHVGAVVFCCRAGTG